MSQTNLVELNVDRRAEAALQLLRSLAKAGEDPDTFAQACVDWSHLEEDATSLPDFMTVLGLLSGDSNQTVDQLKSKYPNYEVFRFDADGTIVSISSELSLQLGIMAGQSIAAHISSLEETHAIGQPILITLPDAFGIARQVRLYPIAPNGHITGYLARAVLTRLSPSVHAHLHHHYGLTKSEIQILELVLRRHTLEHVAAIRNSTLNTVRTHIARLIQKLGCHSLVEAVATALEISTALAATPPQASLLVDPKDVRRSETIKVDPQGRQVEFRQYGPSDGRAVIILHSLEYGYAPSEKMIEAANSRRLNLVFPVRPGFGATSPAPTRDDAAQLLRAFIETLDLTDVTLVGLSFSGPLALAIQDENPRISQTSVINYGLNAQDKMQNIHPRWVRGLLRMGLSSNASFAFGANTALSMIRTFGGQRFFRTVYRSQESDQMFVEENLPLFEMFADYIAGADPQTLRNDIESALLPNPDLDGQIKRAKSLTAMISCDQNGVGSAETEADAKRLGLTFKTFEHRGRNWLFKHPDALFDELLKQHDDIERPFA